VTRRGVQLAALVLVVTLVSGCGGGSKQDVPKKPPPPLASRCGDDARSVDAKLVWFRASDHTLLDGAVVGDGDTAIVLAHGYPSELCEWLRYAKTLASRGYLALAFDFRGFGASPSPTERENRVDRDVMAAYDEARRLGADRVFLMGGSYGGAAVVWAGTEMGSRPAGIIDLSGPTWLFNIDRLAPKLEAPLLVISARDDSVVTPRQSRELVAAAGSTDKEVAVYGGSWHAGNLLYSAPYRDRVDALVSSFLRDHD
jgi:alpha-beta hydrolase superfamily lysophospholipase